MKHKILIIGVIPVLAMCQPIVSSVTDSRRVTNENRAKGKRDFDDTKHVGNVWQPKSNYKIGDRFRLKQPMYLHQSVTGSVQLAEISLFNVPKLEEYKNNPELYQFGGDNAYQVIRLYPRGTIIQFVASKSSGGEGAIYYFVIQGEDDWFRCSSFKETDSSNVEYLANGKINRAFKYNNQLFEKLQLNPVRAIE
jgi:hypothetical protein